MRIDKTFGDSIMGEGLKKELRAFYLSRSPVDALRDLPHGEDLEEVLGGKEEAHEYMEFSVVDESGNHISPSIEDARNALAYTQAIQDAWGDQKKAALYHSAFTKAEGTYNTSKERKEELEARKSRVPCGYPLKKGDKCSNLVEEGEQCGVHRKVAERQEAKDAIAEFEEEG
ncbi:uncharacterized protein PAC_08476 [Phialocephala subalpina]|uniref:Uncharacterized protein n=1 Tax=Phialocephala subalpina TaxID=576137 RepID=A0A1L7X0N6_9HELO|nr:uncharacterized protein PAC_08476 [Phialocephala subalpina]